MGKTNATFEALLRSWVWDPWLLAALSVTACIYLLGWRALRRRAPTQWNTVRLAAFLGGLASIYLALASPIEPFAALLLQMHMLQHLLLLMVAPPLLWLGEPLLPMLRGLPRPVRVYWAAPLLATSSLRRLFERLTHPFSALTIFVATTWIWHLPDLYDLALRSNWVHYAQHLCFLGTGLLFWYPVIRPYPSRPDWSAWLLIPYLILADLANTVLSALLTFSGQPLYPYYENVPRLGGLSALADQQAAGVLMWVPGSIVFLVPMFVIGVRLLFGSRRVSKVITLRKRMPLPLVSSTVASAQEARRFQFDLFHIPLIGNFFRWRRARLCLQLVLVLLAAAIIFDGMLGPQVGAMNLAGVLPWIHWRGVLILGLLAAGNVFCMGCPFTLPRSLARRWLPDGWTWPRYLRNKWLAVCLTALFLWAYEAFSLWDRPMWTAWIALGYFIAAFAVDGFFRGANFCKYVCPIGQFNFVQSLVSPFEIKARDRVVCESCSTKDCLHGRDDRPGCQMQLFVPHKAGNMDCTTCLDCVQACPQDNIGLIAGLPGATLWHDRPRSGIGRLSQRTDIAALVLVLVFGAFANAAGMIAPVQEAQARLADLLGLHSQILATTAFYIFALVILPLAFTSALAFLSRRWDGQPARRYIYALVPMGLGMWLAHYSFHLLTSYETIVPATQRFVAGLGVAFFGDPQWIRACCRPAAEWILPLEILFLDFGLLLSLYTAYRIAPTGKALLPWTVLIVLLFATGVWIVFQPMLMRGTLP